MKKLLLMLAVGIVSVGLLTGCGGSSSINLTDYRSEERRVGKEC